MFNKKIRKLIITGLMATTTITTLSIPAEAKWLNNHIGWWYTINEDDSQYINNTWYNINGEWYYFDKQGYMVTGWFKSPYSGKWYYLDKIKGNMVTNTVIDGYTILSDGSWDGKEKQVSKNNDIITEIISNNPNDERIKVENKQKKHSSSSGKSSHSKTSNSINKTKDLVDDVDIKKLEEPFKDFSEKEKAQYILYVCFDKRNLRICTMGDGHAPVGAMNKHQTVSCIDIRPYGYSSVEDFLMTRKKHAIEIINNNRKAEIKIKHKDIDKKKDFYEEFSENKVTTSSSVGVTTSASIGVV